MEAKAGVLVEDASSPGIEKGLGQFPELGLQYLERSRER